MACASTPPPAPAAAPLEPTPELSGSDAPAEIAGCTPPQRGRTWVGFSHEFELADFGEAAARAETIIAHVAANACEPQPADAQGVLMAAHAAHAMWIARITFQSPALDDVEVLLERVGGTGSPLALRLLLEPPPQAQPQPASALWRLTAIEPR